MKNNPYIGPRPYGRGEGNFFGREREGKELAWLIMAEQAVLFYAQSGAGKTSLLNARVIPILEQKGVLVLPVARVGSALPEGITPEQVDNIFVFSALLTLSADANLPPDTLLTHTLLSYLQTYAFNSQPTTHNPQPSTSQSPTLLILDQFEEIATTHREHWAEAEGFFHQVREAIDALPGLGVLFVLREDYVAELDPYTPLLPSHLQARFRMTLPTRPQAMQIVMGPAEQAGVPFAEEAAQNLVANLSRIKTSLLTSPPVGGTEGGIGQYVEPVQLQVVCQQLWESLPDSVSDAKFITWDAIKHYNVDDALTSFYENTLVQTCQVSENLTGLVTERRLRRWFDEHLITPEGRRGLALQGKTKTAGLPNAVVRELQNHHLLRSEMRGGSRCYELAHDRLVEPIVQSNRAWEAAYYNPLATATQVWLNAGRDSSKLLKGTQLEEAKKYAGKHPADLLAEEKHFLDESDRQAQQTARRRRNTIVAMVTVMVVLTFLTVWALRQKAIAQAASVEAVKQSQLAGSRELAAAAIADLEVDPERSILLAQQALAITYTLEAESALRQSLQASRIELRLDYYPTEFRSVAFSPNGAYLAAAAQDGTVKIWNVTVTNPQDTLTELVGHNGDVLDVTFSPDGMRLATAGQDRTAIIWSAETLETIHTLRRHAAKVVAVAFSPDGKRLATASEDWTAIIWDAETGDMIRTLTGHAGGVLGVAFSPDPDGTLLVTAGRDKTAKIWDSRTGEELQTLIGHEDAVYSVAFHPAGNRLATTSLDKTAILWDISETPAKLVQRLFDHTDTVSAVAFSPGGECLATTSLDGTAKVWDADSGKLLLNLVGHTNWVYGVAFNPAKKGQATIPTERCGTSLATSSFDGTVRVWNIGPSAELLTLTGHTGPVESVVFSPDGRYLASASDDHTVRIWQLEYDVIGDSLVSGEALLTLREHGDRVNRVAFSPEGQYLASASYDGTARVWALHSDPTGDTISAQLLYTFTHDNKKVHSVSFNIDGSLLATASEDIAAKVKVWSIASGDLLHSFSGHKGIIYDAVFSPNGTSLVTTGADRTAKVWDIASEQQIQPDLEHNGQVYDAAFNRTGTLLATASWEGTARLWSATSDYELLHPLERHVNRVYGMHFNPDGTMLATSSGDRTVILWDTASGDVVRTLSGPEFNDVSFSSNGDYLAVGGEDGTVRFYVLEVEALLALSKMRVTRSLTLEECQQYLHPEQCQSPAFTSRAIPALVPTATPTALPEIVYTSDSNPCPRPLPQAVGGGGGQDPLPIAPNEAVLMKLGGHTSPVTSASFSADGKTIVTSDGGDVRLWNATSDVRLWDATSGKLIYIFTHEAGLSAPNLSPNGQMVAAAVGDGTVRLYDTKTGVAFRVLTPSPESDISPCVFWKRQLSTPVFSPDGQIIVTVDGCVAQLWDVATGKEIRLIGEVLPDTSEILIQNGHAGFISGVAFSPNGQVLVTAGEDWSVRMWDVATGEHLRCFEIPGKDYQGEDYVALSLPVAFSPDGRTVASASDMNVFLWDATTSQIIRSFYADWAATVNFSPDGQILVTASGDYSGYYWGVLRRAWDGYLRRAWLWDVNTGQPIGLMKHPRLVNAAVFSPDGQTILTAIGESEFYIDPLYEAWVWDANSEVLAREAFATKKIEDLLEQGQTLVQAGEIEAALAVYAQAQTRDPDIEIDARAIAILIERGRSLAEAGEIEAALAAYAQVQEYDPDIEIGARAWDGLCWFGSLYGYAGEVLFACEKAVELAPDEGIIRHNRGLARAWTGDTTGALDDFRFAVQQWEAAGACFYQPCERSRGWIAVLEGELETLRDE